MRGVVKLKLGPTRPKARHEHSGIAFDVNAIRHSLQESKNPGIQEFGVINSNREDAMHNETIKTIKAAKALGYHIRRPDEFGGEGITIKGRTLHRNCMTALSTTAWREQGYRIRKGEVPHVMLRRRLYDAGKTVEYAVYREDQVEPLRATRLRPAEPLRLTKENVLASIFAVNRSAKRYRDGASKAYAKHAHSAAQKCKAKKESLYELKDRGIAFAFSQGWIAAEGVHGGLVAYRGSNYCFHSTLFPDQVTLPTSEGTQLIFVEAKPRGSKDLRLCDAEATLLQLPAPSGFDRLESPAYSERRRMTKDD